MLLSVSTPYHVEIYHAPMFSIVYTYIYIFDIRYEKFVDAWRYLPTETTICEFTSSDNLYIRLLTASKLECS